MIDLSLQLTLEGVGLLLGIGGAAGVAQWRIERHEKDFDKYTEEHQKEVDAHRREKAAELEQIKNDFWRELGKLRDWRHVHEQESAETRLAIQKDIGQIYVTIAELNGKFAPIVAALESIVIRLDKIDGKIDRIETRDG